MDECRQALAFGMLEDEFTKDPVRGKGVAGALFLDLQGRSLLPGNPLAKPTAAGPYTYASQLFSST